MSKQLRLLSDHEQVQIILVSLVKVYLNHKGGIFAGNVDASLTVEELNLYGQIFFRFHQKFVIVTGLLALSKIFEGTWQTPQNCPMVSIGDKRALLQIQLDICQRIWKVTFWLNPIGALFLAGCLILHLMHLDKFVRWVHLVDLVNINDCKEGLVDEFFILFVDLL